MSETSSVDLTNYETSDLLVFTDAAANKVKNLIEEENNDEAPTQPAMIGLIAPAMMVSMPKPITRPKEATPKR